MQNKSNILKSKKFLLLFIFVMALNVFLAVVLLRETFAQKQNREFVFNTPIKVQAIFQKDCPLQIMVINVDNSNQDSQTVNYRLQNLSNKPIRAYTLLSDERNGQIITNSFTTELLQVGKHQFSSFLVKQEKEDETISLSIDYIEFADGSSWGIDKEETSKEIAGEREGRIAAIKQLKDSIKNQNMTSSYNGKNLLEQDVRELSIDIPKTNQSDKWKAGFRGGYKAVISLVQMSNIKETQTLMQKLDEMEKVAN